MLFEKFYDLSVIVVLISEDKLDSFMFNALSSFIFLFGLNLLCINNDSINILFS